MKNIAKQILVFTMMVLGATGAWAQTLSDGPSQQSNGTWKFTMPAGNRTLRTTWKQEIGLAWKIGEDVVSSVSGYLGFENAVTFPELYFMNSDIAGQFAAHGHYGSSNPTVATIDEATGDVSFVTVGETVIYAVYNDENYYDSVYYTLTVDNPYTLTLGVNNSNWGSVALTPISGRIIDNGSSTYKVYPNTEVTVNATANSLHFVSGWEDELHHTLATASYSNYSVTSPDNKFPANSSLTFTVTGDTTAKAIFGINDYVVSASVAEGQSERGTVQIAYTDGNGNPQTTTPGTSVVATALGGSTTTVTATPVTGYHFSNWNGNVTANPCTTTVAASHTASFDTNVYVLTVLSANETMGNVSGGTDNAKHFREYTISATPKPGYHFDHWNDNNTDNPRIVTLTENTTYTAYFAENPTLTLVADGDGTVTVEGAQRLIDLSTLTANYTAQDGDILTGTLDVANYPVKISVADGATVTLAGMNISGVEGTSPNYNYWAGITCLGDATIVLADGSTNIVKGFHNHWPGIEVGPTGKTLTIKGTGRLDASSNGSATSIGSEWNSSCGNITILNGTINATCGGGAAGIGASYSGSCGDITISGGSINVISGSGSSTAGIGTGLSSTCGDITINGGTVNASGCGSGAGIGTGQNGHCGAITITNGVTSVTATKGIHSSSIDAIGRGGGSEVTCGTVTIGGTVYWGLTSNPNEEATYVYKNDGANYLTQSTLTYNGNDNGTGTGSGSDPVSFNILTTDNPNVYSVYPGTEVTVTATPATNHYMKNWNNETDLNSNVPVNKDVTVNANTTITAHFAQKPTLTLEVEGNGNVEILGNPDGVTDNNDGTYTVNYGTQVTVKAIPNTGYHLASWNPVHDPNNYDTAHVTVTANTSLTANFVANVYSVTLHPNDGTINEGNVTSYTYGEGATLPMNVTKTGYTFGGWYANAGLTGEAVTAILTTETGNKEFWAKWNIVTYSISYELAGGSHGSTHPESYNVTSPNITLSDPTRTGYGFAGWTVTTPPTAWGTGSSTSGATDFTIATGTCGDIAFTATWTPNTNTAYKVYHYTKDLGATTYTQNGDVDNLTGTSDASVTLSGLKRTITGFTYDKGFAGTTTSATMPDATTAVTGTTILPDGSRVISLYYSRDSHNVTLASGTGIANVTGAGTYEYGASVSINATLSNGYDWSKWTQTSGGADVTATQAHTFTMGTSDISYTANATAHSYAISYELAGGSVATANPTSYTVESEDITLTNPTRTGYGFTGWTGTGLDGATSTVTIAHGSTGDRSYTATWTPNTNTAYKVYHYTKDLGATTYTQNGDVDNLTGTSDASVTLSGLKRTITGFTYDKGFAGTTTSATMPDATTAVTETTILPDGSRVISLYYNRNTYNVSYAYTGEVPTGAPVVPAGATYEYGATVPAADVPTLEGYTFHGWTSEVTTMPANNVSVTGYWTINSYTLTINYQYTNGTTAATTHTESVNYHAGYSVTSPTITGYTPDQPTVSGTMGTDNVTVTVTYAINTYTLTLASGGNGSAAVKTPIPTGVTDNHNGTYTINHGTVLQIEASPADHYHFVKWNDNNTDNPRTLTVTKDSSFTASFAIDTYTLNLVANGNGTVVIPEPLPAGVTGSNGTYTVNHGTQVTVTATPATHHYMQKWDDEDPINSNVPVNKTVTVTENTTLTAYFAQKPILTLSTNPSDPIRGYVTIAGTTLPNYVAQIGTSSSYYVDYDSSVTVKATPIDHYHLASWNNTSGNALQQVVTMTADMEITGVFAIDTFTLTLKTNDIAMGKAEVTNHSGNPAIVSHDPDANGTRTYKVNYGAEVIIKATANVENHYHLASWSNGATVNTEDTIHVNVTKDSTVTANFAIDTYTIAATVSPANSGIVNGAGSYNHGATATLTAIPATGYHFVNWTKGGTPVCTTATYTFTVTNDSSFVANFAINTYTIAATVSPENSGSVNGAGTYNHGETATLTAIPATGYHFVNWTKGGTPVCTTATYTFTVTNDSSFVANFAINTYTLTLTPDGEGTVTTVLPADGVTSNGNGTYTVNYGTTVTVNATAAQLHHVAGWSDEEQNNLSAVATYSDYAVTNPDRFPAKSSINVTVTGDTTMMATFGINSYEVNASVANTTDVRGTVKIDYTDANNQPQTTGAAATVQTTALGGSTTTLIAIPAAGYHFVNWTNGNAVLGTNDTLTTTEALTAIANFDTTHAELAWSAEEFTGYVAIDFNNWKPTLTNPHSVNVHYGCVEGNDPDNGGIAVDATTGIIGNETNFGHATMKSGTFHIYAVHETDQGHYYDSVVYTLHVLPSALVGLSPNIASAGTVSMPNATNVPSLTHHYATVGNLPTVIMALNESVDILAVPATGYHFNYWQIPLVPQEETTAAAYTYQFTIPIAVNFQINLLTRTLRAIFDTNTYALNVESANLEMGSGNGSTIAKHFLDYEISATPSTGYHFVQWNDGNTANPRTVTLTSDSTFTAYFDTNSYTITYMDAETELKVDTFKYKQPTTEYVLAKEGWRFDGWRPAVPELMTAEDMTVYAQWYRLCDSLEDYDGNKYASVNVGNKCWMASNLRTTHYDYDGREVPGVYKYATPMSPNVEENVNIYGLLYDWYAATDASRRTRSTRVQGVCPDGWYIPNEEDFAILSNADIQTLRSTDYWLCDNGTNSTGFDMRPSGLYDISTERYEKLHTNAYFWSMNAAGESEASCYMAECYCGVFVNLIRNKLNAFSVRCVKD